MLKIWLWITLVLFSHMSIASSKPLFQLDVITQAPNHIASNQSASAAYTVTNNTSNTRTLVMQAIPGITQITTTTGACPNPIVLNTGQSCLLNLRINGAQIPSHITTGPIVCQVKSGTNTPNPYLCSQPSRAASLFITKDVAATLSQNTWISVLLAQSAPPADLKTYTSNIYKLAPVAEQIHPRVTPIKNPTVGPNSTLAYLPIYQNYADLIADLHTAYAAVPGFQVGFHVDNSKGSEQYWGCAHNDWECVLNNSIIVLNNINALADPKKTGTLGFTIFSIEQSYLEPVDPPSIQAVKACLNPPDAAPGATCPVATIASPVVKYGDVLPSYGDSTIYGSDKFDYGYPQYYNLVESINASDGGTLITTESDSYFPPDSAANCIAGAAFPYNVIDANLSRAPIPVNAPRPPLIPCFTPNVQPDPYPFPANDVFTYQSMADPVLAGAYDAYLMTKLAPISEQVNTNGATVYITFSGEPQFLGSTGWTLAKINAFNAQLNTNFTTLNTLIPGIIPSGANTGAIKYAIWNYDAILENNN
jgi:hypothetical protein